jgi:hypothetical protein
MIQDNTSFQGQFDLVPFSLIQSEGMKVNVQVSIEQELLRIRYDIFDPSQKLVFSQHPQGHLPIGKLVDGPWDQTCFELFFSPSPQSQNKSYGEFNFFPSGDFNFYHFKHYRQLDPAQSFNKSVSLTLSHHYEYQFGALNYHFEVVLRNTPFQLQDLSRYQFNFCVITQTTDQKLNYWSLRHSGEKPDFHRTEDFLAKLI